MSAEAPQFISAKEVAKVLTWPMVNAAVEEAMKAVVRTEPDPRSSIGPSSASYANQPARTITKCSEKKRLFAMAGYVGNYELPGEADAPPRRCDTLACKLVTSFSENKSLPEPLPSILGHILLFSTTTGQLQCIMEATKITAWRTAAASLVATKHLFFGPTPQQQPIQVAIIGCGVQGQSHALGICKTFNVSGIQLWNRTTSKAEALAVQLRGEVPRTCVRVAATPAEAVADADVICVGTYSAHALIDESMLNKKRVHINTVGAGQVHYSEVAQDIYDQAFVYVDSWAGARDELRGLKAELVAEVGEVITGRASYPLKTGVTVFQSLGMAVEDATVAQAVFDALKKSSHETIASTTET